MVYRQKVLDVSKQLVFFCKDANSNIKNSILSYQLNLFISVSSNPMFETINRGPIKQNINKVFYLWKKNVINTKNISKI